MAGIITNAARLLIGTLMMGAGGPFESGAVDIVLSNRTGPPEPADEYDADAVCAASGILPIADAVITGPYTTPAGEVVLGGGCRHYLTTTGGPFVADQAGQWWVISQDVAPVLLSAGMVRDDGTVLNLTAPGIGFDVDIEIPVPSA